MPSQEIITGIAVIVILIVSLGLHEMAHAAAANWCGDDTAKQLGRLTVNPIKHIDPVMTIALPAFLWFVLPALTGAPKMIFGGAKPVPVVPSRLRHRHRDMAIVAVAGPLMNFAIALGLLLVHRVLDVTDVMNPQTADGDRTMASLILTQGAFYNVLLGLFNLIPIPPLDGSRIVAYLLPGPMRQPYVALERVGLLLVIAFVFMVPGTQEWLFQAIREVYYAMGDLVEMLIPGKA